VSSTKQTEGESLETQEATIRRFVDNRGWNIEPKGKVWATAISGRKAIRDDFEEILAFIRANPGLIQYYVFRSIDRLTRAGSGEYERMKSELAKHGVEMVDTYGIIQPSRNSLEDEGLEYNWSRYFPSETSELIEATRAKSEVRDILTRMVGQSIRNTKNGWRTRRPADGYVNKGVFVEGKRKTIQEPHPERAKFYRAMFDLRAQGFDDPEVVARLNAMGYRSQVQNRYDKAHKKIIGHTGGLPLTIKQFQRVIKNTIYAGVMCEKWTFNKPIKAKYPGLVNIETFNKANRGTPFIQENADGSLELVQKKSKTGKLRSKRNPDFPYKFIPCPICDRPMIGSATKGKAGTRHPAYHCTRNHKRFSRNKADFEKAITEYVNNLRFKPELLNALELTLINKYRQREKEIVSASADIHQNIADLKVEQAARIEAIIGTKSPVVRERLEQEVEEWEVKIKTADKERAKIQITEDDIKSFIAESKAIMEHPAEILLDTTDLKAQEALFQLVFEKMPNYYELLSGTPKLSYVFRLSSDFRPDEEQLVTLRGIEPRFQP
jgi:site-specific DNA recombinase